MIRLLTLLALTASIYTAHRAAPTAASTLKIVAEPPRNTTNEIVWTAEQRLKATDFKGSPDPNEPKNVAGLTTAGWTLVPKNEQIGRHWYVTHTDVVTTFYTQKSWLRPTSQAAYVLAHEQGHFDIMEIYARQLERELNARRFTIDQYNDLVPGIFKRAMHAAEDYQNQYDRDTGHGVQRTKQATWLAEIKEQLAK